MRIKFAALSALVAITALPTVTHAEDGPSTSFNVGVVTDYRYRGITQSRLKPALQGGVDYSNPNGLYLGAWASTIKWIRDAGTINNTDVGSSNLELDLYGGYKGEIVKDVAFDVGGLFYYYHRNKFDQIGSTSKAETFEIYGAITYNIFTAKYSHSTTNLFGAGGGGSPDTKGSGYLDLSAAVDLGSGFSLTPHVGRQIVKNYSAASYTDYSLTVSKDMGGGFSLSAAAVGTNADKTLYYTPDNKFTGKNALVLGAKFSF